MASRGMTLGKTPMRTQWGHSKVGAPAAMLGATIETEVNGILTQLIGPLESSCRSSGFRLGEKLGTDVGDVFGCAGPS